MPFRINLANLAKKSKNSAGTVVPAGVNFSTIRFNHLSADFALC